MPADEPLDDEPLPLNPAEIDYGRISAAVREILLAIGEDPDRDGLKRTPHRVAKAYSEMFAGLQEEPAKHLETVFDADYDEVVLLRDIPFASVCEHHLLPFIGRAHVAYLPKGKVVGLSKLARLVEGFARRPQIQEQLTVQICESLMTALEPKGAAVVVEAVHSCMTMRGVKKTGATMITSSLRGLCRSDARTRSEIMSLIRPNASGNMGGGCGG
ncbi:MAG: GTP cyclohydrolase I FolE [Planctomycetota bacterium]